MAKNNASLVDPKMLIQAGINPKTGLPLQCSAANPAEIKTNIKKTLRIIDEQDCINSFTWINLPKGLNGRLMERILYYKGQGILFYLKDKFYFLPYALDGRIDVYGRYLSVTPLPFNGTANDGKDENPWIQGLSFNPVYDLPDVEEFAGKSPEEITDYLEKSCVILKDYTEQMSQRVIARQILSDPILDVMSECVPYMRTSLIASTGVRGLRVPTESESGNVALANLGIQNAALSGDINVPIIGDLDFQDLTVGNALKTQDFLLAMQGLDNYRLSTHGLDSGGLFQKKSHMLEAEQEMNAGNVGLVLRDKLQNRQEMCMIANRIWGTQMWCVPSETVVGIDSTGDGLMGDDEAGQMMQEEKTND